MNFLTNYFSGKDTTFIVSQLIGFVAAALLLLSFQQRTHRRIVVMQACSGFLFAVQYFMLGAYEGMIGNVVGFTRSIIYSFRGKSKAVDHIACPVIFAILAGLGGLATYTSPASLLPMTAMIISSFVIWSPKTQQLRALTMPTSAMWLVYNVICSSYSGVVTEVLNLVSITIGLIRFRKKD
ncbi:MAG: YgjV family protein [Acutalibacteraceae bacterium]|nr:YgjV family protein [Acutalibacteraceae bacterium]